MAQFNVLYFGQLKDITNVPSEMIEPAINTPASILESIKRKYPESEHLIQCCAVSVNLDYVDEDSEVAPSSEIAIIPPVSAG